MRRASPLGSLLVAAVLLVILAACVALGVAGWNKMDGVAISRNGQIALAIGISLTLLLGGILMGLLFHSARSGIDDDAVYQPNKKRGDDNPPPR